MAISPVSTTPNLLGWGWLIQDLDIYHCVYRLCSNPRCRLALAYTCSIKVVRSTTTKHAPPSPLTDNSRANSHSFTMLAMSHEMSMKCVYVERFCPVPYQWLSQLMNSGARYLSILRGRNSSRN